MQKGQNCFVLFYSLGKFLVQRKSYGCSVTAYLLCGMDQSQEFSALCWPYGVQSSVSSTVEFPSISTSFKNSTSLHPGPPHLPWTFPLSSTQGQSHLFRHSLLVDRDGNHTAILLLFIQVFIKAFK